MVVMGPWGKTEDSSMITRLENYGSTKRLLADDIDDFRDEQMVFELILKGHLDTECYAVIYVPRCSSIDECVNVAEHLRNTFSIRADVYYENMSFEYGETDEYPEYIKMYHKKMLEYR